MLVTMCKFGGWYLVYEFGSSALLAAAAWRVGFHGI